MKFDLSNTKIPFMSARVGGFIFSTILIILSFGAFFYSGLNFGIDFKGGTLIEIETEEKVDLGEIRSNLNSLSIGDVQVQEFGSTKNILIRVEQQEGGDSVQQNVVEIVKASLDNNITTSISYRRTEVVGPKVSGELIQSGVIAIIVAVMAMLIYIWFRFEWQFSLGAVIALVHDVILTIGVFCFTQLEFNLPIIAAILTIVGYSMNDTVVIFDRVRENLRKYSDIKIFELTNISINETLSRTIITSATTLLALLAIYFFGGEILKGFSLAMILGVVFGTYSSIYIANTVLVRLRVSQKTVLREDDSK